MLQFCRFQLLAVALSALLVRDAAAQNQRSYIQLSPTVKAVLYSPPASSVARVAVVNMHEDGNRLSDIACTELVQRGFYVLCMNGRSDNNEALDFWNDLPTDVAVRVKYLGETLKVSRVLLYGGSGGAPLMTFYQNVAQNGPSVCQGANKLIPCTNELAGLPSADGIILRDAHPGTAVNTLRSINPSLQRDDKPDQIIASLDPFNPKNGFNPSGSSNYSHEFREKFFQITNEADRMGYRLAASPLETVNEESLISSGVSFGTIQLLPKGQLIILMADHQTTGGYPRIANVISTDLSVLAQKGPNDIIHFILTDLKSAESSLKEQQRTLRQIQLACNYNMEILLHGKL